MSFTTFRRDRPAPAAPARPREQTIQEPRAPVVVCVLGMHRSGTSLVAGTLAKLGIQLGPDRHLMRPGPDNPTGYWEHQSLADVNDAILTKLGGSWHQIPTFPAGWSRTPELDGLRRQARAIVEKDFGSERLWGWKDPRACLTLPFWQALLPPMRYVLCVRHPLDVARSLERRDGFPLAKGLYLWLAYSLSAWRHSDAGERCVVVYDRLLRDWRREVVGLGDFLGIPERAAQPEVQAAIESFVRKDLQHHRTAGTIALDDVEPGPLSEALSLADRAYRQIIDPDLGRPEPIERLLQEALGQLAPEVAAIERRQEQAARQWMTRVRMATREIAVLIPPGESFILVDDDAWATGEYVAGRRRIPFLERDGQYWGPPPDDAAAIRELERLRCSGARSVVFAWPAFWWLEHYPGLRRHLRAVHRSVVVNDQLVVFDLRP